MQKVVFVDARAGTSDKGYDYSIVKLSNGMESFTVENPKKLDLSKYKKGDQLQVEFEVAPHWSGKGATVTLSKVL